MSNFSKWWLWMLMTVTLVPAAVRLSGCSIEEMERDGEKRAESREKAEKERTVATAKAMRDFLQKTNPALPPAERCAILARMVRVGDCLECADDRSLITGVCEAAFYANGEQP